MNNPHINFSDLPNAIAYNPALLAEIENLKSAENDVIRAEDFNKFTAEDYAAKVAAANLAKWKAASAYTSAMVDLWTTRLDEARVEAISSH